MLYIFDLAPNFESEKWGKNPENPDPDFPDFSGSGFSGFFRYQAKPQTISELKVVVGNFFSNLSQDFVKKCVFNIKKRAELCVQQNGGHFESLLWNSDLIITEYQMSIYTDNKIIMYLKVTAVLLSKKMKLKYPNRVGSPCSLRTRIECHSS